ncbi:glycosyltransferase [Alienimonas sp. DA493]|uniref:glycosyltransferase n=1 Tax=Alienimonas sp. DA493 TaxID=3373605 RepID=UPI00375439A7
MKILVVHERYTQPGGEDQVFLDETALLEARGHTVIRYERHNDELAATGRLRQAVETVWSRRAVGQIDALLRRERPDVMHCHNTFPILSPAVHHAAAKRGVATVQTLHNFRLICPQGALRRDGRICEDCVGRTVAAPAVRHACYRGSRAATAATAAMNAVHHTLGTWTTVVDRFVALTEFSRDLFVRAGLPGERIDVKPNFVAPDPGPGPAERTGGVVFVGRLSEEKGLHTLLDAWRRVRSDARLTIVGDGPLGEEVRAAAATDSRITAVGRRPFAEVLERVAAAEALVMPSVWYETFGRTLIEAFAAGTPVIASRLGAMAEIVTDGETGVLFPPGDAAALAAAVDALQSDPPRRRRLGAAARGAYEAGFTADRNYELLRAIYERALARRRPASPALPTASRHAAPA